MAMKRETFMHFSRKKKIEIFKLTFSFFLFPYLLIIIIIKLTNVWNEIRQLVSKILKLTNECKEIRTRILKDR